MPERGSGVAESLTMGALWRDPERRAPLLGTLEDGLKRLWRWTSLFIGAPFGKPRGELVYRGLWELDEGALGMGHCSLKRLHGGGLGEGSFTGEPVRWGFWEICKMPCKQESLSRGALLGNLEGVRSLGLLRKMNSRPISEYLSWAWMSFRF